MKKTLLALLLMLTQTVFSQTGIGTKSPQQNTILDLNATDKALLLPRVNSTTLITTPTNGMLIYDKSSQCIKVYQNSSWSDCIYSTPGTVASLSCAGTTNSGILNQGISAKDIYAIIPYSGGNGFRHNGQSVASTGVIGLTATLSASNFVNGTGTLLYKITGIPQNTGIASFNINIGGQSCVLTRDVFALTTTVTAINCTGSTQTGSLFRGVAAAANASFIINYTGGNGGAYNTQTVASTGISGLTATLSESNLATGSGQLTYRITGTPLSDGAATFTVNIGGVSCTVIVNVKANP